MSSFDYEAAYADLVDDVDGTENNHVLTIGTETFQVTKGRALGQCIDQDFNTLKHPLRVNMSKPEYNILGTPTWEVGMYMKINSEKFPSDCR